MLKTTGDSLTRDNVIDFCSEIVFGIQKTMNKHSKMPDLPYTDQEENFRYTVCPEEAFERSMIAAAFYTQATGNEKNKSDEHIKSWKEGLLKVTDPKSPFYWQELGDHSPIGSQIATAILIAREFFWDPLSEQEKLNIATFLDRSTRNASWDNNHYLFHMTALPLIEEMGLKSNREELEKKFERCLNWYRGDGWFLDGVNKAFDWYNNHGFHLYLQLIYYFDETWRKKYGTVIEEITESYLKNLPLLFDQNGYPIPMGRSLGYRFVNVAPIPWMVANGLWSLDLGLAKGIYNRSLKLFRDNKCIEENGLLAPGFFSENKELKETYMDYGAQYFASHGFSSLIIPEDHSYWNSTEKDIDTGTAVLNHGAVIKKSPKRGAIYFNIKNGLNGDKWQKNIKYCQHSYSSQLGIFLVGDGSNSFPNQSGISYDGEKWYHRHDSQKISVKSEEAISKWEIDLENEYDSYLTTHHLFFEDGEIYIIYHNAARELFISFSGIANLKSEETYSKLNKLYGPQGESSMIDAGLDIYHRRPGEFPHWQSKTKVKPFVPMIFAVEAGLKGNQSSKEVSCIKKENMFEISWGNESYNFKFNGLLSRLKNI
jgi:hypothetical protein